MQTFEIIATLCIALFFVVLGCYNPGPVQIDLFGAKTINLPLPVVMTCMFLMGAAYIAFWGFFERVRKHLTITRLSKRVKELESRLKQKEKAGKTDLPSNGRNAQGTSSRPSPKTEDHGTALFPENAVCEEKAESY